MTDQPVARRTVIRSAGLGIGAGLASGPVARARRGCRGNAQSEFRRRLEPRVLGEKRRREAQPVAQARRRAEAGRPPLPILFLVHGSSNSARSSYDLTVPGKGEYSFMNVLARYGYDVWTMDHDGYGYSGSSGNNSDIASGVEDLKGRDAGGRQGDRPAEDALLRHLVRRHPRRGLRAGAAGRVDRLILCAFTYKGDGAAEIERRRKRIDELRANTRRKRDAAMIRSIFTRDGHPARTTRRCPRRSSPWR